MMMEAQITLTVAFSSSAFFGLLFFILVNPVDWSTQSDFVWTMMYVTSNCVALVAILLLILIQGNISYRYDSLPPPHHNIPVNLKLTNWIHKLSCSLGQPNEVAAFKFCE